ncbi:hypothetical protein ACFL1R_05185 [Candidatus Latescibacterota bacterium]
MKVGFDVGIKLEFHGAKVSSNCGFLAHRDLDDALGLLDSVSTVFNDKRTGRNRYVTFHMTEVTIDKRLFAEILSRIERLRYCVG